MVEYFDSWARALGPYGVLVFGLAALIEYVVPPFPGDTVVVLGGMVAIRGDSSLVALFVAVTVGSVLGAGADYAIGRWLMGRVERRPDARLPLGLTLARLHEAQSRMRRVGWPLLLGNRFFPTGRAVIFFAAGAARMPFLRVIGLGAVSAMGWNLLLLALGSAVGGSAEAVEQWARRYQLAALGVLGVVVAALGARAMWKRRSSSRVSPP